MSRLHEPTPDDILRDTSELAGNLYCILVNTEASPLGPMHGTSDPVRTMAWDLASAAVIAIITEEVGRGDFAITIGRTLIECGESENAKSGN